MSDAAAKRVSTSKQPAETPKLPLPKTLQRATIGAAVQIALSLITVAMFWGFTPQLKKLITDNNAHLKKPLPACSDTVTKNCLDVLKSLHAFRSGVTEYTVIASLILVFLVFLMRRGSGAGRWIYLIASVFAYQVGFAGSPMSLFVIGTETPTALKVVQVLAGLASIAVIVLLLMPASAAYFRASGAALREARGQTAQQRPAGLAGLFAPRQPVKRAAAEPDPEPEPGPSRPKAKAKVRTDADAVAKGADLARARAKASKSRRATP